MQGKSLYQNTHLHRHLLLASSLLSGHDSALKGKVDVENMIDRLAFNKGLHGILFSYTGHLVEAPKLKRPRKIL